MLARSCRRHSLCRAHALALDGGPAPLPHREGSEEQMRGALVGMVTTLGLILVLALATQPDEAGRSQLIATAGLAIDAPNAVVLERDARQYALEMAKVEAQRAQDLAVERTMRFYAVIAGAVIVALCVALASAMTRRPQRVIVVHRIEGAGVVRLEEVEREIVVARGALAHREHA